MILSFVNIRKVPREVLKTEGEPEVFNTSLGTLRMLMNEKSCLIPLMKQSKLPEDKEMRTNMDILILSSII